VCVAADYLRSPDNSVDFTAFCTTAAERRRHISIGI